MVTSKEWIDQKIKDDDINFFKQDEFDNIKTVGQGAFGTVNSAYWKHGGIKVALKILTNIKEDNMKELLKELKNLRKVSCHPNINQFLGITKEEPNNYIMVLQYANHGNLRDYLKENFASLQWNDKIQMALDIACGLKCLHSRGIIHRDLHSKNILVNDKKLMIADLGLSKQMAEIKSNSLNSLFGMVEYMEPQLYKNRSYERDNKSDIYSLGILFWEISSGHPPFLNVSQQGILGIQIANSSARETPVKDTPLKYKALYQKCWNEDPKKRPDIDEVYESLDSQKSQLSDLSKSSSTYSYDLRNRPDIDKSLDSQKSQLSDLSKSNISDNSSSTYSDDLRNFDILKYLKPENETLEIIQAYLERNQIGWTENSSFGKFLEKEKYKLKGQEIFNYIVNNQNIQHYEVMVGNFHKEGFGTDKNEDKAFELYIKASQKGDVNGYYEVGYCYYHGRGVKQDHEKAFVFYQLAANHELNIALMRLGDCYQHGKGTHEDKSKAFELYKKSAENKFIPSLYILANCYKCGNGIQEDKTEALKWFKKYKNIGGNVSSDIDNIEKELEEELVSKALDEIIQSYLTVTKTGWTKSFSFNKVLDKYRLMSQKIFNHLMNNPTIQHYEVMIGKFYYEGFGIDKNKEKCFEWCMKGSQKGDIYGHYEVGYCYYDGNDNTANLKKAVDSCKLAANNGLNIALFELAFRYDNGFGIQENKLKAFELYKKSAENGFIPSQYELASFYRFGKGIAENKKEALKWYKEYQENDGNIASEIQDIEKELEQEAIPSVKTKWFRRKSFYKRQ